ncbi:MAG: hypothetical protein GC190_21045 [Alphaproteobacteria bacterium]|nr:hypothetical protein [Alphaproteobacteria bacterium]
MARVGLIQASFAGGELSPRLYGRSDIAKYQTGAEVVENWIPRPEGGLMRRHGTRYAGSVKTSSKQTRVVPFIFSTIQAYIVEFGDQYIRVWKDYGIITSSTKSISNVTQANPATVTSTAHGFLDGDRVIIAGVSGMTQLNNREFAVANAAANTFDLSGLDATGYGAYTSGGTASKIYEIASPYLEADLDALRFAQSADILYVVHPSYPPARLTRTSHTSWTLTTIPFDRGPFAPENTDKNAQVYVNCSTYQPGDTVSIVASTDIFDANMVGSYFYMSEVLLDQLDVSPWTANQNSVGVGGQVSSNGNVYERIAGGAGSNTGDVAPSHIEGDAFDGQSNTRSKKWRYRHSRWGIIKITGFTDAQNVSGLIETYLPNGFNQPNKTITNVTNASGLFHVTAANDYNEGDFVDINSVSGSGGMTDINKAWKAINVTSTAFDLEGSTFTGSYTSGGKATRFATYRWRHSAFSASRGYPAAVTLHEQRLCWANTAQQPYGFWASRAGDYDFYLPGTFDDDPIAYNIASNQVNAIRWLLSSDNLLLGSLAQEFAAYGGGLGDPITPANTRIVPQSSEGSSAAQVERVAGGPVFINRAGRKIFALAYGSDTNGYQALDLTELADHLASTQIFSELAWAKNPASILWVRRSDGSLCSLTFRRDQQIVAWARHPIDGFIESIAVIPSPDGTVDDLWMVVRRTINGATLRSVEYLAQPFQPSSPTDKAAMAFMDAALSYSGAATSTLSGLAHLEGKTVKVIADSALHADRVVTGGAITLESPATQAWVGLPYASRVRALRLEGGAIVTAQGKTKRVSRLTVRVLNGLGGHVGPPDESVLEELVQRDLADPMDASPPLRSGDFDVQIASDYDTGGQFAIVQSDPLPLDILCVMPQVSVSEG